RTLWPASPHRYSVTINHSGSEEMNRIMLIAVSVLFAVSVLMAASPAPVADAERSFSKLASEKGIRASFVQFMAADSLVFHDTWVNGQEWYQKHPEVPGNLYWMSQVAGISAAGDMGYSTGPWEYRKTAADEKPLAYGSFASIWKKQSDGSWKVALDLG